MVLVEAALLGVFVSMYVAVQIYFCRHPEIPNGVQNISDENGNDAWNYAMYNKYAVW